MSDAEWAVTEPALPGPAWKQGRAGPPAGHCRRDIAGAIRYLVKEGICWRAMPANFSPWQTVYAVLDHWQDSGAPKRCTANCAASAGSRPAASRSRPPRSSTPSRLRPPRPWPGTARVRRGTIGLLLTVLITAAGSQDRDAARPLLWNMRRAFPRGQAQLGRWRLRRQARHLCQESPQVCQESPQAHRPDRLAPR